MLTYTSTSRLLLAALHYNNNNSKQQAVTKAGEEQYSILFPKYKKGGYIVRKVMKESSYGKCSLKLRQILPKIYTMYTCFFVFLFFYFAGYVKDLMCELLEVVAMGKVQPTPDVPDFLCSQFQRPEKITAIKDRQTRFTI